MADAKDDDMTRRVAELVAEQLAERIGSQLKTAFEALDEIKLRVSSIQDDTSELVSDMRAVKQAIRETNLDLRDIENRVNQLEISTYHA